MTGIDAILRARQQTERGWIIRVLSDLVVGSCDCGTLRMALNHLRVPMDQLHFRQHLDYLADKNYIALEPVTVGHITNLMVRVTAHGRDLRGGVVHDAGVNVEVGE